MDEPTWQSKLLKAGINITHIDTDNNYVYFDFAYRPTPGGARVWGKSVLDATEFDSWEAMTEELKNLVLKLRMELEG